MIKTHQAAALHNLWHSNLKLCIKMALWIFASTHTYAMHAHILPLSMRLRLWLRYALHRHIRQILGVDGMAIEAIGLIRFISMWVFKSQNHSLSLSTASPLSFLFLHIADGYRNWELLFFIKVISRGSKQTSANFNVQRFQPSNQNSTAI